MHSTSLRCRGVPLADLALRGGRLVAGDAAAVLLRLPAADELLLAAAFLAAELKPARLPLLLLLRRTSPNTQCMERLLPVGTAAGLRCAVCLHVPPAGLPPLPTLSVTVKGAGVMTALLEMGAVAVTPLPAYREGRCRRRLPHRPRKRPQTETRPPASCCRHGLRRYLGRWRRRQR